MRGGAGRRGPLAALRAGGPPAAEAEAADGLPPGAVGAAIYRQHLLAGRLSRAPPCLHEKAEPGVRRGTARRAAGREGPAFPPGWADCRSWPGAVRTPLQVPGVSGEIRFLGQEAVFDAAPPPGKPRPTGTPTRPTPRENPTAPESAEVVLPRLRSGARGVGGRRGRAFAPAQWGSGPSWPLCRA